MSEATGSMFWVVLYHVRSAPSAICSTLAGSVSKRPESGAFGLLMSNVSHPPARTRAAMRPATSGIRLVMRISGRLLRSSVRGSEVDLRKAGESPEVGVRETVEPERVRVARQAGHLGIVSRVLREREQVASNHSHAEAVDAQPELRHRAAVERVADVQLLDLHVRPRLDEEIDRVNAIVEEVVIIDRLTLGRRLGRLVVHPVHVIEERPLPRAVIDAPALHPVHERIGGEALIAQVGREARIKVAVHVGDMYSRVPAGIQVPDGFLVRRAPVVFPDNVSLFV